MLLSWPGNAKLPLNEITLSDRFKLVLNSRSFLLLQVLAFSICFAAGESIVAAQFGCLILTATLITSSDLFATIAPLMLFSMSVLKHYGGMPSDYLEAIPYAVAMVLAFALHFVKFPISFRRRADARYPLKTGKLFASICAVCVAVMCGGIGVIRFTEYFSLNGIYYVLGLGPLAVLLYVIVRTYAGTDREQSPRELLCNAMIAVCLMGVCMWLSAAVPNFAKGNFRFYVQWKNNLSTFLLLAFPFAFYMARRSKYALVYHLIGMAGAIVCFLTYSRGGMLFGAVMLVGCLLFGILFQNTATRALCPKERGKGMVWKNLLYNVRLHCMLTVAIGLVAAVFFLFLHPEILTQISELLIVKPGESRFSLFTLAIRNFLAHPFLGVGLGYVGKGLPPAGMAMYWYHSTPFQIIGSMGLVGVVAYVWQFFARMWVLSERRSLFNVAVFLSFAGFELMALVNPGDFCPFPYVYMLSVLMIACEWHGEQPAERDDLLSFDGVNLLPFVGLPTLAEAKKEFLKRSAEKKAAAVRNAAQSRRSACVRVKTNCARHRIYRLFDRKAEIGATTGGAASQPPCGQSTRTIYRVRVRENAKKGVRATR